MSAHNIIIGVVIIILLYLLYLYFFGNSSAVLVGIHDASTEIAIPAGSIAPAAGSANFTFSIWVYVSNWSVGTNKVIFERPCGTGFCPKMAFTSNLNNIDVTLATYAGTSGSAQHHHQQEQANITCTVENVPLQSWANIIMTLNGRALDLYLDGKLVRTCVLPGVPKMSGAGQLMLTPSGKSFQGYTSNFQYFARAINPREAYAIYREGYGGSNWLSGLFNKYRIKMAFMEDNQEVNSFEI